MELFDLRVEPADRLPQRRRELFEPVPSHGSVVTNRCPSCEDEHRIFGRSEASAELGIPTLARLPLHPDFDSERTDQPVVCDEDSPLRSDLVDMVKTVADAVGEVNRRRVSEHADVFRMYP